VVLLKDFCGSVRRDVLTVGREVNRIESDLGKAYAKRDKGVRGIKVEWCVKTGSRKCKPLYIFSAIFFWQFC
jgi:hypothetical protein